MTNRRINIFILSALTIISALTLRVAIHNDMWREFVITEIGLVITAVALLVLLRDKNEK